MYFQTEIKTLHKMEYERIAELSFLEIKTKLYQNEIPWEKIPEKNTSPFKSSLSDISIDIDGLPQKILKRSYSIHCKKKDKEDQKGTKYRLIEIHLDFDPPSPISPKNKQKQKVFFNKVFVQHI